MPRGSVTPPPAPSSGCQTSQSRVCVSNQIRGSSSSPRAGPRSWRGGQVGHPPPAGRPRWGGAAAGAALAREQLEAGERLVAGGLDGAAAEARERQLEAAAVEAGGPQPP